MYIKLYLYRIFFDHHAKSTERYVSCVLSSLRRSICLIYECSNGIWVYLCFQCECLWNPRRTGMKFLSMFSQYKNTECLLKSLPFPYSFIVRLSLDPPDTLINVPLIDHEIDWNTLVCHGWNPIQSNLALVQYH